MAPPPPPSSAAPPPPPRHVPPSVLAAFEGGFPPGAEGHATHMDNVLAASLRMPATMAAGTKAGGTRRIGRTRWSPPGSQPGRPTAPGHHLAHVLGTACPHLLKRQSALDDVQRVLASGRAYVPPERERSPSPEPMYDANGVRTNGRDVRVRNKLMHKRQRLIAELVNLSPPSNQYKPPPDYKPEKLYQKIFVPLKEYPTFNFIGLIIGPRGRTQKRLEKETGCKIAVRGKGSMKEGMKSAAALRSGAAGVPDPSEHEDLHVLVTGETREAVRAATKLVEQLLDPGEAGFAEFKTSQLRELAVINGTWREDGEGAGGPGNELSLNQLTREDAAAAAGAYQLPKHIQERVDAQYERDLARANPENARKMDEEFTNFMEELGGGLAPPPGGFPPPPPTTTAQNPQQQQHQ